MSARTIAADLPTLIEPSPFAQHFRSVLRALLRKFVSRAGTDERVLAVEARVAIGPKKSLVLVRCHGRRFLIASAGDTIGPVIEVGSAKPGRRPPQPVSRERKA
jgi:flagellar biogenesis protein FliO